MGWWGEYYPRRKPKKVKGGIKAQSKRGAFGESWWAKRWNQTLEEYDIGARLGRGRSYARSGQVETIDISKGKVSSIVHGSDTYEVSIRVKTFETDVWRRIAKDMFARPAMSAQLLAGKMPKEIEDVFDDADVRLFPKLDEIETDCTCPDWSNPCKHIAAVYLLLAEEFDRDPFLIFHLRGTEKKNLLKLAGMGKKKKENIAGKNTTIKSDSAGAHMHTKVVHRSRQLSADPQKFWRVGSVAKTAKTSTAPAVGAGTATNTDNGKKQDEQTAPDANAATVNSDTAHETAETPAISAALVKQLGTFPFWRSEENFMDTMEQIYQDASEKGSKVFLGDV